MDRTIYLNKHTKKNTTSTVPYRIPEKVLERASEVAAQKNEREKKTLGFSFPFSHEENVWLSRGMEWSLSWIVGRTNRENQDSLGLGNLDQVMVSYKQADLQSPFQFTLC